MDFFEYASIAQMFVETDNSWVVYLIGGLCFAIVFVFQAVGLYVIAGREGYENRWMAFLPFFNTYYIGVCAQKNRFFKLDTKKIALATAIFELLLVGGFTVYYVAFEVVKPYFEVVDTYDFGGQTFNLMGLSETFSLEYPDFAWAAWCFNYLYDYILNFAQLLFIFAMAVLLSCFFQTYSAKRYFIFTITSILFPVQGIFIFVLRNNKGMNYAEYMRREQERQYRMYQQYQRQSFDSNPYNQNPYNANTYQNPPQGGQQGQGSPSSAHSGDDPFEEFGNSNKGPFDEFDSKNN